MDVKGFPTLKIVRPRKGGGKPAVEDYNGARTATGIVEAVVDRINNYVKKVTDKDLDKFLSEEKESPKAILFTEKGTTTALMKSIAIDFLDVITVAQVRDKEAKAVETFGIEKFPTLVLLPGGDKEAVTYDGELKKPAIVKFLSQAGEPNPDPAPVEAKPKKKSSAPKSETTTASEEASEPSESAETQQAPVIIETAPPIPTINTAEKLAKECLAEKSSTCLLAFVQSAEDEKAKQALESLSDVAFKYAQKKHNLFPMYEVPKEGNAAAQGLFESLELSGEVEIIAVNARRSWWRRYEGSEFDAESIASWVDDIRMGEGSKKKLPENLVGASFGEAKAETAAEEEPAQAETAAEEEPAQETVKHEEL
jgi:protein disulfide-isomerase A6